MNQEEKQQQQQQINTVSFHLQQAREPPTVPARSFGVSKAWEGRTGFYNPTPSRGGSRGSPGRIAAHAADPETRPRSHRCTPNPRPQVCAPRLARGSPSRPRHGSKKSPRVASAAGPPNPSSSRITSQRSRLCDPSGLQRPPGQPQPPPKRRSAPEERAGKGGGVERDLDAEPPNAGSGDTWTPVRLLLSVSKQTI